MPIFQAIGLGVLILVLKFLVPAIFTEVEATVIAFLHGARVSADVASSLAASAATTHGSVSLSALPLTLPSAAVTNP
jgi:hypothetical protein